MRIAYSSIQVTLVMPSEYDIQLKLDGDKSTVTYREKYDDDVPEDAIKRTVEIVKQLQPTAKVELLSSREVIVNYTGNEHSIVNAIVGEFDKLRECVGYRVYPPVIPHYNENVKL